MRSWKKLCGGPAPDRDIAISHGRLKLDSQDRYARQKAPFRGRCSDDGVDEGEVSGSCRVSDLLEHDYIASFTRTTGAALLEEGQREQFISCTLGPWW